RFDNLEAGIRRIRQVFAGPLLIGGGGERRTMTIAAREAAEWNMVPTDPDSFRAKSAVLDQRCREVGRDPGEIRRSMMRGYLVGRDRAELLERFRRLGEVIPRLQGVEPEQALAGLAQRFFVGTPHELVAQMRPYAEAGVELFMLQHFLLDDAEA